MDETRGRRAGRPVLPGRLAALVLACLALAGCAGRAEGVLRPQAVATPGAREVSLLVATTRRPAAADDGTLYGGERGRGVSFLEIGVSIPPVHRPGEVEWPPELPADPARHFATTRVVQHPGEAALASLRRRVGAGRSRHVLVFVHGYNTLFEDAVYRFAQIVHDTNAPVTPLLFTWPSRGRLLAYAYDRESANYSRDALEGVLQTLARDPDVREVSILAHSMGNWVTLEALRQMAIRNGALPPKIGDVILAAPDVDVDVAVTQIRAMGPRLPRFTLFSARDDRALTVSRAVWGGTDRLGAIDPTQEPYRSTLARYRIAAVDLSGVSPGDAIRHDRFAQSQVVGLIGRQLAGGQGIGGRPFGVGDQIGLAVTGAAATVGSAAGLVLTAPLAVVDPATRENFGERLETLLPGPPRASAPLEAVDLPDPPPGPAPRARAGRVSSR